MDFDYFINQTINGLGLGSVYALVALGYTMVYGIVKLINFAHGEIIMVGSYIIFFMMKSLDLPLWFIILVSMLLCGLLGVVIEKLAYKPLRNAPRISALITAIGISIFLQNLFAILFKPDSKAFPPVLKGAFSLRENSNIILSKSTVVTIVLTLIVMFLLTMFIKKTRLGKAMRAVSEDSKAASLMGINADNTIALTFFIGSALAALGGAFYSIMYSTISPFMGQMFGLKAFVAAVFGGIGILPGAMFGGFFLGLSETYVKGFVDSNWANAIVFTILILVLIIKPSGVFGKNVKEKV